MRGRHRPRLRRLPKGVFARVLHVEKPVLVLVFRVHHCQRAARGGDRASREQENGLFGLELDSLPNDELELTNRQIRWDQVLDRVDHRHRITLLGLLTDDRDPVGVLFADANLKGGAQGRGQHASQSKNSGYVVKLMLSNESILAKSLSEDGTLFSPCTTKTK